ncbi:MAG: SAM-dependent methyltransferase [Lachnospiraceae bacterium]|nr:SAM-dependent methyltransferase [Lachnospiraceae bacterium]
MQEELRKLLEDTVNEGLYRITISNPRKKEKAFKIKIRPVMVRGTVLFQETLYEGTKVFHENRDNRNMIDRIEELLAQDFKQCEVEHQDCRVTVLVSKKGRITINRKRTKDAGTGSETHRQIRMEHNRTKKYILEEGTPVPFLVDLGVQTVEGRVVHARYDKFRQINRFLEFIEDILPTLSKKRTVHILDFGCGKSYLTFAMYYYLHELKKYDVEITGLDLKEDVIDRCNRLSEKYGYDSLRFLKGDIAEYKGQGPVDIVVTLHACDTATDYALAKAVLWNAGVILSVPCCQHEVNRQIKCEDLAPVLKYGIVKERFAALVTDALRAQLLEAEGYAVDILEFIDMEHTPKNLLIRAVRQGETARRGAKQEQARRETAQLTDFLNIRPTLQKLLTQDDK